MPSFDIVSELDMMEVENAVNSVIKEIAQRFDFRGAKASISLDKLAKKIVILADDELKMRSIHGLLEQKVAKRSLDPRCIKYGKEEAASGNMLRQTADLKSGIAKDEAKEITAAIKESKLKVQAQIQDEQVRVTGKSIDDLQAAIALIKSKELGFPVQFINMRK